MAELTDKFVWVRVIKANDLDLTQFQFDFGLTFAIIFMNADKTIYGRYGSRSSRKDAESEVSVAGLAQSMKGVLKLHEEYPKNKRMLAGKQAKPSPYKTPLDIPKLRGKYRSDLNFQGQVVKSCVHCHQVSEAMRDMARKSPKPMPLELIYPHPSPSTIGFSLDPKERARVKSVEEDSITDRVLREGDEIISLDGQPIVSQADVQWVLHHAKPVDSLSIEILRNRKIVKTKLRLPARWRFNSNVGWRSAGWEMRRMALGGLKLVSATPAQRRAVGVTDKNLSLVVDYVGQYVAFGTAKKVGFRKGDMIIKYGPLTDNITESQLLGWSVLNNRPGQKLPVTIIRGSQRMTLQMPMQQ